MKLASLVVFLLLSIACGAKDHGHSNDFTFLENRLGPGPLPSKYFGNTSRVLSPYTVDPVAVMEQRLVTFYDGMVGACCKYAKQCSNQLCARKCPGSCSNTGWSGAPTTSISSFTINGDNPASYTPTLVVPQNYTNYNLNTSTSATFNYQQSFTDTVTVTNSETLTVSMSITESVKVEILTESMTIGFSFSTTETTSKTTSEAKTWSIQYGPVDVPACSGLYLECYVLTANFNPTFTAVYKVDGTPTDQCDGNWHWDMPAISSIAGGEVCITCNPELCPSPGVILDNTITITGRWNGIVGAEVQCNSKPYPLPRNQCE